MAVGVSGRLAPVYGDVLEVFEVMALDRPYVFRSSPHLVCFQDFTESNPQPALDFPGDPDSAALLYYALFCELSIVHPLPNYCVPMPREMVTCKCGKGIYRTNPNFCDSCCDAYFSKIELLMKQEEADKLANKEKVDSKKKLDPVIKSRPWKPVVQKAPRRKKAKK